jgi:hypothetical protein
VLRHVDAATVAAATESSRPAAPAKELIVLVGGYQSCACPDDGTFDAFKNRVPAGGRFDVVRFGADPRYPYDSFGAVAPSAVNLRDHIRSVAPGYAAVHVVSHSMGGVVADRAFEAGLSRDDGVVTYVSWSAPHSGSDAARAMVLTRAVSGESVRAFRESLLWFQMESESDAVRDLARARAVTPPVGVVRLDLREATDVLVTDRDARSPGVPSRILTRAVEGHGGILQDPEALDQTLRTISERRVPPDERSRLLQAAAQQQSQRIGSLVLAALCVVTCVICVTALAARSPFVGPLSSALGAFLPRAGRRPCP